MFVTFTEQVVPSNKHITLFWVPLISGTKTVTMKLTKKAAVKLSDHTSIIYLLIALIDWFVSYDLVYKQNQSIQRAIAQ